MIQHMKHWNNAWEFILSVFVAIVTFAILYNTAATPITGIVAIIFAAASMNAIVLVAMCLVYALWKTLTWRADSDGTNVAN